MSSRWRPALLALLAPVCLSAEAPAAEPPNPCAGDPRPHVAVEARQHALHLCDGGEVERTFLVSLGTGGLGKRRQGDKRTPLGRYRLGRPRPSRSGFHTFVPVAYPTRSQRKRGFTGGAIGIHGPPDYLPEEVTALARGTDWTDGCLLVFTNREIQRIAKWVKAKQARGPVWLVVREG